MTSEQPSAIGCLYEHVAPSPRQKPQIPVPGSRHPARPCHSRNSLNLGRPGSRASGEPTQQADRTAGAPPRGTATHREACRGPGAAKRMPGGMHLFAAWMRHQGEHLPENGRTHLPPARSAVLRQDSDLARGRGKMVLHRGGSRSQWLATGEGMRGCPVSPNTRQAPDWLAGRGQARTRELNARPAVPGSLSTGGPPNTHLFGRRRR